MTKGGGNVSKTKVYTLTLPDKLHKAVKVAAATSNDKTMNDIIVEATAAALGVDLKGGTDE
jgi:hypothetical protein